jgi:SAM-dependent methyltransferase
MPRVDYEKIAQAYDRRYAIDDFTGIERCLRDFLGAALSAAELGCGTGHWLAAGTALRHRPFVVGLDSAWAMLSKARKAAPHAALSQGSAECLPWCTAAFDRVFCINALHHFPDHPPVLLECSRVLRSAGGFMTIGLDPHAGEDRWWIYDYFPGALEADLQRYPSGATIRAQLVSAGFQRAETIVAQHIHGRLVFDDAKAQGLLDRQSTSQLLVISDAEWAAGLARLHHERPDLQADLRLYATIGWRNEYSQPVASNECCN